MLKLSDLKKYLLYCSDKESHFDNEYTKVIADNFGLLEEGNIKAENLIEFGSDDTTAKIADKCSKILKDESNAVLFINLEGLYGIKAYRQEQLGVEILKWLRCKHNLLHPIILYGVQCNSEILKQKPENLIINSEGCYYYQLPFDFAKLKESEISGLSKPDILKPYLKPAINLEEFRHREANLWGVKSLWDVHKVYTKGEFDMNYPDDIKNNLKDLNSYIVYYYYSLGSIKFDMIKNEIENEIINKINNIENHLSELYIKLTNKQNTLRERKELVDRIKDKIADLRNEQSLCKDTYNIQNFRQEITNLENLINLTNTEIDGNLSGINEATNDISDQVNLINELNKQLDTIFSKIYKKLNVNSVLVRNIDARILYIDDKANSGWGDIFQYMIYNKLNPSQFIIINPINKSMEDLIKEVDYSIDEMNPDLVLLDLRLFDESGFNINIDELSGKKVLDNIRKHHKSVPVIIVSASNKIANYEELIKAGADSYWIKEGIDDRRDLTDSIKSYLRFINLISITNQSEYKILKSMGKTYKTLKHKTNWWEEKTWTLRESTTFSNKTKVTKNDLLSIYLEGIELYKEFLSKHLLQSTYRLTDNGWFYFCAIINHMGKIIELVHNINRKMFLEAGSFVKIMNLRGDKSAEKIYNDRNRASHIQQAKEIRKGEFADFINKLNNYIVGGPKAK